MGAVSLEEQCVLAVLEYIYNIGNEVNNAISHCHLADALIQSDLQIGAFTL
jgi:hypothetical protein